MPTRHYQLIALSSSLLPPKAVFTILLAMWAGNNVTRPFRVAGAAALAPALDGILKKVQAKLRIPYVVAFFMAVAAVATPCLTVIGLLFLSRRMML